MTATLIPDRALKIFYQDAWLLFAFDAERVWPCCPPAAVIAAYEAGVPLPLKEYKYRASTGTVYTRGYWCVQYSLPNGCPPRVEDAFAPHKGDAYREMEVVFEPPPPLLNE